MSLAQNLSATNQFKFYGNIPKGIDYEESSSTSGSENEEQSSSESSSSKE
jgi:hypothetical protein